MPTYDYVCNACGHALEIFQSMSESPKRKCPACGKSKLERRIGAGAGFLFKGSGFYLTDYRSKSYADGKSAAESAANPAKSDSGASDTPSAETKPAKSDAPSKPEPAASPKPAAASPKKKPSRGE